MNQVGDTLTGNYSYKFKTGELQQGKISGKVVGNVLTFTWSEKSNKRSTSRQVFLFWATMERCCIRL